MFRRFLKDRFWDKDGIDLNRGSRILLDLAFF